MEFFVPENIYQDRIAICKSCEHYLSLLGNCGICKCFMKIKARLAPMECADNPKKWQKTTKIEVPEDLPEDVIEEIKNVWQDIESGVASHVEAKRKMVELYNAIHNTGYNPNTNCGSCLSACRDGIQKLYNKYKTK